MNVGTYLEAIRGLMDLKRYQNLYVFKRRSVAEHSWSVAKISQSLAHLEVDKFGNEVDYGLLLQKAICHDELEILTGDILSHTKRKTKAMRRAVDSLETQVYKDEYSKNLLPSEWNARYIPLTLEAKDESFEGAILAAADVIDTIFEAVDEIKLGNRNKFENIYYSSVEKLQESKLQSAAFFIENALLEVIEGTDLTIPEIKTA